MNSQDSDSPADLLAAAWDYLDDGDVDRARAVHQRLSQARGSSLTALSKGDGDGDGDRQHAGQLAFLGAVLADMDGDGETALSLARQAHALVPHESRYLVFAAELMLEVFDDAEEAVRYCDLAIDGAESEDFLFAAALCKAEALASIYGEGGDGSDDTDGRERRQEAHALLEEVEAVGADDAAIWCRIGDVYWGLRSNAGAARAYARAIALDDGLADAHYGLGQVAADRGDMATMTKAWLRTRELDLAGPRPTHHMSEKTFAHLAERALAELPPVVHERLANVPLFAEDLPSEDMVREGIDPRLLGLFSGVPLPDKSHAMGQIPQLDSMHLFQRNLERATLSAEQLAEEIRITVLHESAHFFGLDDDELDAIGLG